MPLLKPAGPRAAWAGLGEEGGSGASRYLSSTFESYAAACKDGDSDEDATFTEGLQRVEEHILSTQGEVAACLICLESIALEDPIWHCQGGCYEMVHLVCIQQWARQQLAAAQARAEQQRANRIPGVPAQPPQAPCWGCPKCRHEYVPVPIAYTCFCGKTYDPPFNPWNAPHSCGERCERESRRCGHPCCLLCHPGPCPPCPRIIPTSCYCGAVHTEKRCGRQEFSCGGVCGRELACGHACPQVCHEGECPPCGLVSKVACRCGAERRQLPCSQHGSYQCARVCGKLLGCGRHTCSATCHAGPCGECQLTAAVKTCPCGKHQELGAACDVVLGPCGSTCDKLLDCGIHRCNERCHVGPCSQTCRGLVEKTCACGKTTKTVQCHEAVRCERRCTLLRRCGRHPCKRRCCNGECPPCDEVCGRRLRCGNHRCPAPCHAGACSPCPLTARISCACGTTSYSVPCGRERLAPPPPCTHPCPVRPLCRHAGMLEPHRCHFGPCPGPSPGGAPLCPLPCGTPQPRCGHPCQSPTCHDPLPPPVPDFQPPPPPTPAAGQACSGSGGPGRRKKGAPAEELPPALQAARAAVAQAASLPGCSGGLLSFCPPCQVPVQVTCLGGHSTVQVPCSSVAPFSCGAACGRPLPCGNHSCAKPCHDTHTGACQACVEPCCKRTCPHPCPSPCHPGECPRCGEVVVQACHCGKTSLQFECWEEKAGLLPDRLCCSKICHRALPHCPHVCKDTCHVAGCPAAECCREEVTVRCGCKRLKRKLPCHEVQALLLAATGSRDFHAATPLRLLPCDSDCAAAMAAEAASKAIKGVASGAEADNVLAGSATMGQKQMRSAQCSQLGRGKGHQGGSNKAEAEKVKRQKIAREQKKVLVRSLVLAMLMLVALLLGISLVKLLRLADEKAQYAWRPSEEL